MNTLPSQPSATGLLAPQLDYILLDGSGSMSDKWFETSAALDAYLRDLRLARANSHLILSTFDSTDNNLIQRNTTIAEMRSFAEEPLTAHFSSTPLYDAISIAGWTFRDLAPSRGTLLIATDGEENASRFTELTQAKAILDWMRAKGWQVIFFGCDFNNSEQARQLGANEDTAIGVSKALLSDAASMLAHKRTSYGLYGTDIHFSKDEQQQFGGLLAAPKGE